MKYKGKSIFDVLDMTVEEALGFFENVPTIRRKIETLYERSLYHTAQAPKGSFHPYPHKTGINVPFRSYRI